MAELQAKKTVWVVSQNIDGLHEKQAVTKESIFTALCTTVIAENAAIRYLQAYLQDWHHAGCGGQIRPAIVLYGEGFTDETIEGAIQAVARRPDGGRGTSLQVYPLQG